MKKLACITAILLFLCLYSKAQEIIQIEFNPSSEQDNTFYDNDECYDKFYEEFGYTFDIEDIPNLRPTKVTEKSLMADFGAMGQYEFVLTDDQYVWKKMTTKKITSEQVSAVKLNNTQVMTTWLEDGYSRFTIIADFEKLEANGFAIDKNNESITLHSMLYLKQP